MTQKWVMNLKIILKKKKKENSYTILYIIKKQETISQISLNSI